MVNDVAFTSDGQRILGAGSDKRILVWDVHGGQARQTLTGHSQAVTSVCCSPLDATVAVTASEDRSLKIWDLARGYSTRSIPCAKTVNSLCVSLDGSTIITGTTIMICWHACMIECRSVHCQLFVLCRVPADGVAINGMQHVASTTHAILLWSLRSGPCCNDCVMGCVI